MANLKEIRIRITSVKSTQQITSAMKMVSAAKFRKAQTAIFKLRPYALKQQELLSNISAGLDTIGEGVYSAQRELKKVLVIVITSNKGLCGAFNSNMIKAINHAIQTDYSSLLEHGNVEFITIGKKGSDYYKKRNYKIAASFDHLFEQLNFDNVAPIAEEVMQLFADKKYDRIILCYNHLKNAAMQIQMVEQFLPVKPAELDPHASKVDYLFEPDKETIITELVPKTLKIQFYKALLDSFAAEHGARMTAMHMATDNAGQLLKELQLNYNKARQATITNEILEIVSGAEALKG